MCINKKVYTKINNCITRNQKGLTIVEMLIYIGLLSIILLVLTDIFVSLLNLRLELNATSYNEQDGRYIISRLKYDIENSQQISVPVSNGSTSTTMTVIKEGNSYTYLLNNDNLQLTNNLGTFNLNSSETSLQDLTFKRVGSGNKDTVQIKFTLNSKTLKTGGRIESKNFQTTVGIR